MAIDDLGELPAGGRGIVERIERPIARVCKRKAKGASIRIERPLAEELRTRVGAVGLKAEGVLASGAVIDDDCVAALNTAHIVAVAPAVALRRGGSRAGAVGAHPEEVQAASGHREIGDLLFNFTRVQENTQNAVVVSAITIVVFAITAAFEDGEMMR
ncbi:MAG: hypothetical protein PHO37_10015 [Kiritimatiellae bacterium]|nr:hypothetical protein [Kiritimatiellia bacterium]